MLTPADVGLKIWRSQWYRFGCEGKCILCSVLKYAWWYIYVKIVVTVLILSWNGLRVIL